MVKDKLVELDNILGEGLKRFGYRRKRMYRFECKIDGGIQYITYLPTKTRGKEEVYIDIYAGFNYPDLNKIVSFIKNEQWRKGFSSASHNIYILINPKKIYGFYIDQNTDVAPIAENILLNVEKYVFPFLEKCNTLEKFESMLLKKDDLTRRSTLERPEWNLLALSLLLERNNIDDLIKEYYDDFSKNLSLLQVAQEQIKKYDNSF